MLHAIIDFAFADVTCLLAQGNPSNGAVLCTNENRVTSVCTFSCSAGYDLVGSASTTCLNDGDGDAFGVWSNTRPFCIRKFVTACPAFSCLMYCKQFALQTAISELVIMWLFVLVVVSQLVIARRCVWSRPCLVRWIVSVVHCYCPERTLTLLVPYVKLDESFSNHCLRKCFRSTRAFLNISAICSKFVWP